MSNKDCESLLEYKSVDIYFIYSFLIDFGDKKYLQFMNYLIEADKKEKKEKKPEWTPGTPDNRHGITPFLHIKKLLTEEDSNKIGGEDKYLPLSFHKTIKEKSYRLKYFRGKEIYAEFPVDIEIITRIFYNGSGCVTFKISADKEKVKKFGLKAIKQILSLNRRMFLQEGHAIVGQKYLYEHFIKILNSYFKNFILCKNVVELNERRGEEHNIFPQNPSIFSIIELDRGNEEEIDEFWKFESEKKPDVIIKNKNKEVANILLQIIEDKNFFDNMKENIKNIRIPPRLRNSIGLLKNHSWDYRIMTCINRNSSLLVTFNKNDNPVPFIEKSFLDIFEILRTRWHMNIVLNALLDHDIDDIKDKPSNDNLRFLKKIIDRRKQYAYFLHDPLPYRYLGGSITDIIDIAESEMWSAKLRDMTFRKFEVLDKLYEDQMRYIRITELKDL